MRRLIKLLPICVFILLLAGCVENKELDIGDEEKFEDKKTNYHKIALEDIKKNYAEDGIKNIYYIGEEYILLESQEPTASNQFDIYNLKTGEVDSLPKGAEFVTLEEIIDENEIVLFATGKDSETSIVNFPYLIRCVRTKESFEENDDYTSYNEDKYFSLDYSLEGGSKERTVISQVRTNEKGIEVSFSPIAGEEAIFYAATTDIPPTKTSYDKENNKLILEISTKELSENIIVNEKIEIDNNYISSYDILQKNSKTYIEINLNKGAETYLMRKDKDSEDIPYLSVVFQ